MSLFSLHSWKIVCQIQNYRSTVFFILFFMVSHEKYIQIDVSLQGMHSTPPPFASLPGAFRTSSSVFKSLSTMCLGMDSLGLFCLGFIPLLGSVGYCHSSNLGTFQPLFLQMLILLFSFFSTFLDPSDMNVDI